MATVTEKLSHENKNQDEEEEEQTFEEVGLDARLIHALIKKGIDKPTPIQRVAIPFILEGKDVVAWAKTSSGKTFAYVLPLLQKLFSDSASKKKLAPTAFILVPTRELSQQEKLHDLVTQQPEDRESQLTRDEMLLQVLGACPNQDHHIPWTQIRILHDIDGSELLLTTLGYLDTNLFYYALIINCHTLETNIIGVL